MIARNEVIKTFHAIGKICKHYCPDKCGPCPISRLCKALTHEPFDDIPEILITESAEIIENWASTHLKTYRDDFLEKFPKAKLNCYGCPIFCRTSIYGTPADCEGRRCAECWAEEMEEES